MTMNNNTPESFFIPITYQGKEMDIPAKLITTGFTYRIAVELSGQTIFFEPDEERNFRAVIPYQENVREIPVQKELLKVIAETLDELFK